MIQYQKTSLYACDFIENDVIFRRNGRDSTMMTSRIQNQFFQKSLANTNPYTKFGVPMTFGLGVRWGRILSLRVKSRVDQTPRVK